MTMQIYNDEIYHFGKLGMKWGHHKIQQLKKYNDDYKTKINKIANSKTAHKADVEAAKKVNKSTTKRLGEHITSAVAGQLVSDLLTGKIKDYGNMSSKDVIDKVTSIGKSVVTKMSIDEITARSVADKYNTKGQRVKGSNKELFTREQVAKVGVKAAGTIVTLSPYLAMYGNYKLGQMQQKKRAGEAAFNRWGDRILSDKRSDYSNVIPNVNYSVS